MLVTVLIFMWKERLGVLLWGISGNGSRIQFDKRCVDNAFFGKRQNLCLYDTGQNIVVKVFEEMVKRLVRRKG